VKQYVLRYWETEFDALRPRKSKNNQRVYSRRDVETAMMIKKLLYQDRFSIEGARTAMRQLRANVKEEKSVKAVQLAKDGAVTKLRGLVSEIQRVRALFA
ncbi:MAG TPA: MerR family transcriptional regulator, partial [Bdellovibrionales bacterium]|nr:MerR family transcriptional regulator [Bdellovibrionales bacterium]